MQNHKSCWWLLRSWFPFTRCSWSKNSSTFCGKNSEKTKKTTWRTRSFTYSEILAASIDFIQKPKLLLPLSEKLEDYWNKKFLNLLYDTSNTNRNPSPSVILWRKTKLKMKRVTKKVLFTINRNPSSEIFVKWSLIWNLKKTLIRWEKSFKNKKAKSMCQKMSWKRAILILFLA